MPPLSERYSFEAEWPDGRIVTEGGDLKGCVRFSLIPAQGAVGLPRHDLAGVPMVRRFNRGFVRGLGGGLREYVHCVVCEGFRFYATAADGTVLVTPEDFELYL